MAENKDKNILLKVKKDSKPRAVAGALTAVLREQDGEAEMQAVGAAAVNQLAKSVAIARGMTAPGGGDLAMIPSFQQIDIDGEERTALRFKVVDLNQNR